MSDLFVKVCGLDTSGAVAAALDAGADALGFVWWDKSPRHLDLGDISRLTDGLPRPAVLVTVDLEASVALEAALETGVSGVQPHGRNAAAAADAARRAGLWVIRPIAAGEPADPVPDPDLLLVDTPGTGLPGGSGTRFDLGLVSGLDRPFLLAGGLGPKNVAKAVRKVRPFGVDASSRLESSPGVKDTDRIRRFVEEAKQA